MGVKRPSMTIANWHDLSECINISVLSILSNLMKLLNDSSNTNKHTAPSEKGNTSLTQILNLKMDTPNLKRQK